MSDFSELTLTAIAFVAVLVALVGITRSPGASVVSKRLAVLYGLLTAFFALRLAIQIHPNTFFNGAILLVAAWLPFAQLRLGEDIVRYHAPRLIKLGTLVGAIFFSCLTIFAGLLPGQSILIGLAIYQALTFASVIYVLVKHRGQVSEADRCVADTFILAILIGIPLAMTDFRELLPDAAVRGGAFGMLIMVLATSHFASGRGTPQMLVKDIAASVLGGAILAMMIMLSAFELSGSNVLKIAACATAASSLVILIERFTSRQDMGSGIIHALGQTKHANKRADLLSAHPLFTQGRLLDEAALGQYPKDSLAMLLGHQVVTRQTGTGVTRDAAQDLLDRFAASHLMRISISPPQFLAISAGELAGPSLDDELILAARLIEVAE
jgi:hypothetical protein